MKVYIYSGIPGSGKSTLIAKHHPQAIVICADDALVVNGAYCFDAEALPAIHAACRRRFIELLLKQTDLIVVDNTNMSNLCIAFYHDAATAYGYDVTVVEVSCRPVAAFKRCVHNVPWERILAMYKRFTERRRVASWNYESHQTDTM